MRAGLLSGRKPHAKNLLQPHQGLVRERGSAYL
jgi:hypothetical protein